LGDSWVAGVCDNVAATGYGNLSFNRSGTTMSETAEIIAEILHGVPFGAGTEGVHWRRIEASAAPDSRRITVNET
jgi:hypothetical protein